MTGTGKPTKAVDITQIAHGFTRAGVACGIAVGAALSERGRTDIMLAIESDHAFGATVYEYVAGQVQLQAMSGTANTKNFLKVVDHVERMYAINKQPVGHA
jgi:hypothetical protein